MAVFKENGLEMYWGRELSAEEVALLTKNPWQIFEPRPKTMWQKFKQFVKGVFAGVRHGR